MDWLMGCMVGSGLRGAFFAGKIYRSGRCQRRSHLAENMQSLAALSQESESLGLQVSWIKTKIQNFLQAVDQVSAVTFCGEAVDVVEVFS